MTEFGLNSIRLPVGWWYWAAAAKVDVTPYTVPKEDPMADLTHPITNVIKVSLSFIRRIVL